MRETLMVQGFSPGNRNLSGGNRKSSNGKVLWIPNGIVNDALETESGWKMIEFLPSWQIDSFIKGNQLCDAGIVIS
jgi:hypothetical protein